jgi:hypothetical protein
VDLTGCDASPRAAPTLTNALHVTQNHVDGIFWQGRVKEQLMKMHRSMLGFVVCAVFSLVLWTASLAQRQPLTPAERKAPLQQPTPASKTLNRPLMFDTPEADALLANLQVFPPDNAWNQNISDWPLHPNSANMITSIGRDKVFRYNTDMAFVLVPPLQSRIPVDIGIYEDESDPGPYPVPSITPIEGWPVNYQRNPDLDHLTLEDVQRDTIDEGGDRHAIVVDPVHRRLWEFYQMRLVGNRWQASQASYFDLKTNALRPAGWTSADAAGLPIFPAIVRNDELQRGEIRHAMRVTVSRTRRAYVHPARHYASSLTDENLPRMGERIRLKASVNVNNFTPPVRTILRGLQQYGMFVADNGIDWAISVAPDPRIPVLHEELRRIRGSDFEVVTAP